MPGSPVRSRPRTVASQEPPRVAGHPVGALAQLDENYAAWVAGVRRLGGEGLARACGPAEGPFATAPMATLVLHINREIIHHGAEIALLRDLYRSRYDADQRA
ncbi:MAG: DinB family protein [Pseudonocardiaceae bacterium]